MTGLVMTPNASRKIMRQLGDQKSNILDVQKPLNVETKPIAGLKGTLWNEMLEIHN
jgi:hypothetical protein